MSSNSISNSNSNLNIQPFNFYDSISKLVTDDYEFDSSEICSNINKLDDGHQELIEVLIHHYNVLEKKSLQIETVSKSKKLTIPYSGKYLNGSDTGILNTFDQLPPHLQKMIAIYVSSLQ